MQTLQHFELRYVILEFFHRQSVEVSNKTIYKAPLFDAEEFLLKKSFKIFTVHGYDSIAIDTFNYT